MPSNPSVYIVIIRTPDGRVSALGASALSEHSLHIFACVSNILRSCDSVLAPSCKTPEQILSGAPTRLFAPGEPVASELIGCMDPDQDGVEAVHVSSIATKASSAKARASLLLGPPSLVQSLLSAREISRVYIIEVPNLLPAAAPSSEEEELAAAIAVFLEASEGGQAQRFGSVKLRCYMQAAGSKAARNAPAEKGLPPGVGPGRPITHKKDKEAHGTAQSLYFLAPGQVELRRETLQPRAGELLVESRIMAISHGTELRFYSGNFAPGRSGDGLAGIPDSLEYPLKYGYMNAGQAGSSRVFAFYPHQDRFFARAEDLLPIPHGVSFEDAVLLPSVETALGIVHDAAPSFGESVLVVGLGAIGLITAEILASSGLGVMALDPHPLRRAAAERAGIPAVEPGPAGIEQVMRWSSGRGVDIAVNTSGSGEGLAICVELASFEGTCVEASWYDEERVPLALGTRFHRKRLSIRASQVSSVASRLLSRWPKSRRLELVWQLIAKLRPSKYISHAIPLSRAPEAFELIAKNPQNVIQVALLPER